MDKVSNYPMPEEAQLSVVIPVYNAEAWMEVTLKKLWDALSKTAWRSIEIIIVDDGSGDGTVAAAKAAPIGLKVKIISQKNQGRFLARKTGIEAAKGDYIFFIDSRVHTHPKSFVALQKHMEKHPTAVIWNGHVEVERRGNPFARFWHTVTFLAWRRYMARPRLMHYGFKDFDYYPKGTTCFLVPRDLIQKAYAQFNTVYDNLGNANDDSSLIRYLAKQRDIYIAPDFAFTYHSRSTLRAFMKHTTHRGVVFIDGFMHKGTRYYYPLLVYLIFLPLAAVLAIFNPPILVLIPLTLVLLFILALALRVGFRDALSFACLLPIFACFYTVGLYKGLLLKSGTAHKKKPER